MIRNRFIVAKDPAEVGRIAAGYYIDLINTKPRCVLGLATGSTPLPLYRELAELEKKGEICFKDVRTVNLDEYKGLKPDHPESYRRFMKENLFDCISIDQNNTYVPDGMAEDVEAFCDSYEEKIEELGGIDIQLLGIGHDGHIGFNEPDSFFPVKTHETKLTEMTREANKRFFDGNIDLVPEAALTMGIGTVMSAAKVILIATGKDKHDIIQKAFFGPVTPEVPASILQMHPDCVVIVDEACMKG